MGHLQEIVVQLGSVDPRQELLIPVWQHMNPSHEVLVLIWQHGLWQEVMVQIDMWPITLTLT